MNREQEVVQVISNLATQCRLEGPTNISIQQGANYGSGYTAEQGYYFVDPLTDRYVRGQDGLSHEAAHLVRIYNEKKLGIGLDSELDRISRLVDVDIQGGFLEENFVHLNSLLFSKGVSDEFVACYFGVDRDKTEALDGAGEHKSEQAIIVLRKKLGEWKEYVHTITTKRVRIDDKRISEIKTCLDYSKSLGKFYGAIVGNWLVGEHVTQREVMLHDSSKLFEMLQSFVVSETFPEDLAEFMRQRGVFNSD